MKVVHLGLSVRHSSFVSMLQPVFGSFSRIVSVSTTDFLFTFSLSPPSVFQYIWSYTNSSHIDTLSPQHFKKETEYKIIQRKVKFEL